MTRLFQSKANFCRCVLCYGRLKSGTLSVRLYAKKQQQPGRDKAPPQPKSTPSESSELHFIVVDRTYVRLPVPPKQTKVGTDKMGGVNSHCLGLGRGYSAPFGRSPTSRERPASCYGCGRAARRESCRAPSASLPCTGSRDHRTKLS